MNVVAYLSSSGERELNEDCIGNKKEGEKEVYIVADGLGAHGLGNIASQGACDIVLDNIFDIGLEASVDLVQSTLLEQQEKNGLQEKMKTTITVMVMEGNQFIRLHLGDSRIYHFSKRKMLERTLDHSVCQKLANANLIKEKEIRHHRDRNKLLEVLGATWKNGKPYEIKEGTLNKKFEAILMCTDGFWEWIDEKQMVKCLKKSNSPQEWLDAMEKIILENGQGNHMDNYSAIAIFHEG